MKCYLIGYIGFFRFIFCAMSCKIAKFILTNQIFVRFFGRNTSFFLKTNPFWCHLGRGSFDF